MQFYVLFKVANQKARKAVDNIGVILNRIHLVYGKFTAFFPSFIPGILPFWGLIIVNNKLTSVLYAPVLL